MDVVNLFGIGLHRVTMGQAIVLLSDWMCGGGPCRYVVTPNVDHIVKLQSSAAMRAAYRDATLVVADGWPIVTAARLLGQPLPERVAGSDLVPRLLAAGGAIADFRVYLLGAAPGIAALAAEQVEHRWPGVTVCGVASPLAGFETDREACGRIVEAINSKSPHLLVVGFGAPKQEVWLHEYAPQLHVPVAIAAGATIDFLAGRQRRAPVLLQRLGLEWLYRLATNPRRLAGRYAVDAVVFPRLVFAEWRRGR